MIIAVIAIELALGAFVLLKAPRNRGTYAFLCIVLLSAIWSLAVHQSNAMFDSFSTILWMRAIFVVAFLQGGVLLYFSSIFPHEYSRTRKVASRFVLPLALALATLSVSTDWIVQSVVTTGYGNELLPGKFYFVFIAFISTTIIAMLWILLRKYRKVQEGLQKAQLMYLLGGMAVVATVSLMVDLFIPLFMNNQQWSEYGPFSMIVLIACISYAITRHRFLDIHLAAKRTTLYAALLAFALAFFYGAIFIADSYLGIVGSYEGFAFGIASTVVVAVIAYTLWRRFRRYPRILRNYTTLADELQGVADTTLQQYDPKQLLADLRHDIADVVGQVTVELYLWDFTDHVYFNVADSTRKVDESAVVITALYRRRTPLWKVAVQSYAGEFDQKLAHQLRQATDLLHADAILPLFAGSDLTSFITLFGISEQSPAIAKLETLLADYRQAIVYLLSYQQSIARAKRSLDRRV